MTRAITSAVTGASTFFFQTACIASLPDPLSSLPFMVAIGATMTQHIGIRDGAAWVAISGVAYDAFGLAPLGYGTISGLLTAGWILFASRHVFSSRSLYGTVFCVLTSVMVSYVVSAFVLGMRGLFGTMVAWSAFFHMVGWGFVFSLPCAVVLFFLARRVRPLFEPSSYAIHRS